ncbi:MAG: hypothetical protein JNJ54_29830 [Myxococcaceae bacterium]|nr:hypothetical protein [Myxococcaceae bacterium]
MRRLLLWAVGGLAGCSANPTCPLDPFDAGCDTRPECADAGEGLACASQALRCTLCAQSYHSFLAECRLVADGGLRWTVSRGTPPPGCPPGGG